MSELFRGSLKTVMCGLRVPVKRCIAVFMRPNPLLEAHANMELRPRQPLFCRSEKELQRLLPFPFSFITRSESRGLLCGHCSQDFSAMSGCFLPLLSKRGIKAYESFIEPLFL